MEVQEYRLSWDTTKRLGFISLRIEGKWTEYVEYTFQNFTAAAQILQNEKPVYVNESGYWTGPEKPGE